MRNRPKIAIVGPGRLGSALAMELSRAGYKIVEVVSRNSACSRRKARELAKRVRARAADERNATLDADLIWLCVPDREIASVARRLAKRVRWEGRAAVHSSGALASDELHPLRKRGAAVASVHPLMTFVTGSVPSLKGVPFAMEGDAGALRLARRIALDLGADPFTIRQQDKAAYHAWGAFASPLLVALLVSAEQVAKVAGVAPVESRRRMMPIVRQTIANYAALGPAGAVSGPLVRGDVEIVGKHLQVLKKAPHAEDVYLSLARLTLRHLPVRQRAKLEKALKRSR